MSEQDPLAEEPEPNGTPRWQEREFLILVVAAALYCVLHLRGDASPESLEFVEQLLLVAAGAFGVSRGLAKHGKGGA